jgi:hypothetical protein
VLIDDAHAADAVSLDALEPPPWPTSTSIPPPPHCPL